MNKGKIFWDRVAGADFKRQFTVDSYRQYFPDAGYLDVQIILADGRIPCAIAVMKKADFPMTFRFRSIT